MAFANFNTHQIHCKIVYFGAAQAGKTSNLQRLLESTTPEVQAKQLVLERYAKNQPAPLLEFLPISIGHIKNHHLKAHIYVMPPDHLYSTFLSVILKGIDGFVFVADSCINRLPATLTAWQATQDRLLKQGCVVTAMPAVMQYNKQDHEMAMPSDLLQRTLNPLKLPSVEASATEGYGVLESLHTVTEQLATKIEHRPPAIHSRENLKSFSKTRYP